MNGLYPWQHTTWQTLQELRNRLPNGLLIKGAQGIGKLDLAMNFARSLLCEHPRSEGHACLACSSCHWFEQGSHPDFRLIQPGILNGADESEARSGGKKPSREISVEQIRDLAQFANLSSHCGRYRIVLIHPAETMNTNAVNSLLKTLEEPTANLLFLLVAHKPQLLLPTILSRCLSFGIPTPAPADGIAWLSDQGVKSPGRALAQTGYAPLQALQWAESGEGADERRILLENMRQPAHLDPLSLADTLQRSIPVHVIHCLQQWCHDLASAKLAGQVRYFPDESAAIHQLVSSISANNLLKYQKDLLAARRAANHPLNQKLFLESLLLSYRQLFTD